MTVPSKPRAQQEKQERLARALRENLKKRKQQQRLRAKDTPASNSLHEPCE